MNPVAAYSVRLLDSTVGINYSGNAMRIRRDNDDAEIDIGFDSNGDLDEAAIAAHCTTNNGFVVKWYSQTGQYDAVKEDNASQGRIYNGSIIIKRNGKPAVTNLNAYITQIPSTGTDNKPSYSIVARNNNIYAIFFQALGSPDYWNHQGSQFNSQLYFVSATSVNMFGTNIYSDTAATNGAQAHYLATNGGRGRYASSSAQFTKDITLNTWDANNYSGTLTSDFYSIGASNGRWQAQEVILWDDDCSSMNTSIENYVNDYFNIYT